MTNILELHEQIDDLISENLKLRSDNEKLKKDLQNAVSELNRVYKTLEE